MIPCPVLHSRLKLRRVRRALLSAVVDMVRHDRPPYDSEMGSGGQGWESKVPSALSVDKTVAHDPLTSRYCVNI